MEVRYNEIGVMKDKVMKDKIRTGIRYDNASSQSQHEDAADRP